MKNAYSIHLAEHPGRICIADLSEPPLLDPTAWWIHRINVPTQVRGRGYGTTLLGLIIFDADAEGVELALTPLATGGLTKMQLRDWYLRHGFVWVKEPDMHLRRQPS